MKTQRTRLMIILTMALLLSATSPVLAAPGLDGPASITAGGPTDWPTFGHDPGHTGYNHAQPKMRSWALAWEKDLKDYFWLDVPLEQVAVSGQTVVANANSRYGGVIAFDVATGAERWRLYLFNKYTINPVTIAGDNVYFQAGNHTPDTYLYAVDLSNGNQVWRSPFPAQWERYYAPVVADGRVFINGGYYGGMYAFNAETGAQDWFASLPQYDAWTPAYADGVVYSYVAGIFTAWNPVNGAKLWDISLGWDWSGWSMNRIAVVSGDTAYVTVQSQGLSLVAIDLATHQEKWRVANGAFAGTPAVAGDEVYALDGAALRVYDRNTGQLRWSYQTDAALVGAPLVTDGNVLFASHEHTWMLDRNTQQSLWETHRGGWLAIAQDRLFISQPSGVLAVYQPATVPGIAIDIKPGEPDNIIDLSQRGKMAVAVLSAEGFDAPNELMWGAFTFGRTGAEKSLLYRKGDAPYCSTRDVNADGLPDLVCYYLVKLTGFQVGDTEGVLVGMTTAGGPFEGRDRVQVVP